MNKLLLMMAACAVTLPAVGATAVYDALSLSGNTRLQCVQRLEAPAGVNGLMRAPGDATNITWGYCGTPYTAFPLGIGNVKMGILISEETLSSLAGNQITALQIANPATEANLNPCNTTTIWVTTQLGGEPIATTEGTLGSRAGEWSTVSFDTPVEIPAGGELYVGYDLDVPTNPATSCYVTDYTPPTVSGAGLVYSDRTLDNDGYIIPDVWGWRDWAPAAGCLCLRVVIEGDNLPQNQAQLVEANVPGTIVKGEKFAFSTTFVGKGANNVSELTYVMDIEGMESQTYVAKANGSAAFGDWQTADVEFTSDVTGANIPYTLTLTQVNGVDNLAISSVSGVLNSVSEGYKRNVVFEEFTGTWCGYCVMGIAGMEYMHTNYADKGFIGIAVHGGNGDAMQVMNSATMPYYTLGMYVSGFPSSFVNRQMNVNVYPAPPTMEEAFLNVVDIPSIAEISATFEYDNKTATINTKTTFGLDVEAADFSVAYTVIENEVGPYAQTNYMSGQQGDYYGWESKPQQVSMKFNDVARRCSKPMGIENSLPASVEKGVAYEYGEEFSMTGVKTPANCSLVAMVLNNRTGMIENACIVAASENSGVDTVGAATSVLAKGGYGFVEVAEAGAAVYTVDGRRVAVAAEAGNIALPAGIYIVSANGRAAKVVVR